MFKFEFFFVFFLVFFRSLPILPALYQDFWIIWNVGQGQWVTHIIADSCLHYDVGGELGRYKKIRPDLVEVCFHRQNKIFLSHWDLDHYFHIPNLRKEFPKLCWQDRPDISEPPAAIARILNLDIPPCSIDLSNAPIRKWTTSEGRTKNDRSSVYADQKFLLPGDSPVKQEKIWIQNLKGLDQVRFLILGHHGSRTSTSPALLKKIVRLRLAIASARGQRFGHPHKDVVLRLQKNKTPILKTEDWGSIRINSI